MDDSSCLACLDLRLHTYLPKVSGHDVKFISVELLFFLLFLFFFFFLLHLYPLCEFGVILPGP